MGIYTELNDTIQEVDIIIAGGGTAGCVIASRLADADKSFSILVVEGGPNNSDMPTVAHPALDRATLAPGSANVLHFKSRKEEQLSGREVVVSTGGLLGGGSSVNGMIYQRGQLCDFDSWNTKGWSGSDVLPFLRKFETYDGEPSKGSHGYDGPVHVSGGSFRNKSIEDDFIASIKQQGYPEIDDLQDLETVNAVSSLRSFVSPKDGRRQDTAHAYLHPRLRDGEHPNLHVLIGSQVIRVTLDQDKRATGVEFRSNPKLMAQPVENPATSVVKAKKLVILTAGTFGSPAILERSGLGDSEILKQADVPVVVHLPGVGHGYQDHQTSQYTYKAEMPEENNWESIYNGKRQIPELLASNDKILTWNGVDASCKIRPTAAEVNTLGLNFRQIWDQDFEDVPNSHCSHTDVEKSILGDPTPFPPGIYFTICSYATYPYSRGHVHITGSSMDDPIDFKSGYLSDPDGFDLKAHVWAYKEQRQIARGMRSFAGEISGQHPAFPDSSESPLVCEETGRGSETTDTGYTADDDAAIHKFLRERVGTTWHPLGTCKMAPVEQMGVVDGRLGVHGIKGLKVADLSIAPKNVSGNTMSTALMIGERAADIFIQDLGMGSNVE